MNGAAARQSGMKHAEHNVAEIRTTTLRVGGMSCGACVRHVSRALEGMTGVVHVQVDLGPNEATVEHLPAMTDAAALVAAIRDAGYLAKVIRTVDDFDGGTSSVLASASGGCGCCGGSTTTRAGTLALVTID